MHTSCSPVTDPARVAARALASDVVAGVSIATRRAAMAAAFAVEASGARLVAFGAVPAGLASQAAALRHRAWLLALTLTASGEGAREVGDLVASPQSRRPPGRPLPPHRLGLALTGGGSPGRRSQQGTARGSTCPGSRAHTSTCRPPGGSGHGSTGNSARSARRTCARGTGSGRFVARTATSCRRTDCCSCGPTSLSGTGTRPSVGRSATWHCSSTRWRTVRPTSQARSDTRRSADGTRRAGTGTHARSVRPSAARDTYTVPSRPRTARAGGKHTAPCSRDPRTGAGTLQGEQRGWETQGLARGRGPSLNLPAPRLPAGSYSRMRPRPPQGTAHPWDPAPMPSSSLDPCSLVSQLAPK